MALIDFGPLAQSAGEAAASHIRLHAHEGCHGSAHRAGIECQRPPADHTVTLEPAQAFVHRRGGQSNFASDIGQSGSGIGLKAAQNLRIGFVQKCLLKISIELPSVRLRHRSLLVTIEGMELHDMWQISLNPRRITAQRLTTSQMAAAALVLVVALWGVSFVVVRSAIAAYPVVGFLVLRFVIGGGALMAVAYLHRGSRPDWGSVRKGSLLAVGVALAVGYVTQTLGLQLGASPGVAATLTSLVVVLTPAWEWAMSGRTPDRRVAVSSLLAIAGTLMICETAAPAAVSAHGIPALGVVLEVVSAAAFALQVVLVGRLGETLSATALGGAQLLLVALILLPALPFTGGLPMPSAGVMAAITFSALGASAFGFAVQAAAQKHISTAAAAVIMATEPGFALIAGVLVGEQNIGVIAGLGFALLLLGVVAQTDGRWGNRVRWLLLAMVRGNRLRRQEA